ncbi:hypothetical protein [Arabidopsis thaliana]|nr:hypothetical protein [Arabidopsis thaliana]CAB78523.1 hypothetical protein [Arabidopsis thaliana]
MMIVDGNQKFLILRESLEKYCRTGSGGGGGGGARVAVSDLRKRNQSRSIQRESKDHRLPEKITETVSGARMNGGGDVRKARREHDELLRTSQNRWRRRRCLLRRGYGGGGGEGDREYEDENAVSIYLRTPKKTPTQIKPINSNNHIKMNNSQQSNFNQVLDGGGSQLGINVNETQALALPKACHVETPPASRCHSKINSLSMH